MIRNQEKKRRRKKRETKIERRKEIVSDPKKIRFGNDVFKYCMFGVLMLFEGLKLFYLAFVRIYDAWS